jgi:hypothetical protein
LALSEIDVTQPVASVPVLRDTVVSELDLSSNYDIADDYANTFNEELAEARDQTIAIHMQNSPAVSRLAASHPIVDSASSSVHLTPSTPTPPTFIPDLHFPYGSSFQPVRFNEDVLVLVPITRDEPGNLVDRTYKHVQKLAEIHGLNPNVYELYDEEQTSSLASMITRLKMSIPTVIRNPFTLLGNFNMEFLRQTYRMVPCTPVDIHGQLILFCLGYDLTRLSDCLTGKTERLHLEQFFSLRRNEKSKCAIRMLPVTVTRYFSDLAEYASIYFFLSFYSMKN